MEDVLRLLGLEEADEGTKAKIQTIYNLAESRLLNRLRGEVLVPDELRYIVTEVSIVRFNRIGSEGVSSHSVDGESMVWGEDDFAPYQSDIEAYLSSKEEAKVGKVRFI